MKGKKPNRLSNALLQPSKVRSLHPKDEPKDEPKKMRIAYLDCFSGISGDMFLGALVDAGVSPDLLKQTVAALNVGATIEISRVTRGAIAATKVDVYAHGEKDLPPEVFWEQRQ